MPDTPEFMTPARSTDVALSAMIETQRAIADSVKAAAKTMEGMQAEMRAMGGEVRDVRERVVRIEAVAVDKRVAELEKDVDLLKADKAGRDSVSKFAETVRRWMPSAVAIIFVIILFLRATGRLGQ